MQGGRLAVASVPPKSGEKLCSLPKAVGQCRASMPRWWFNITGGLCQSFVFGGCKGNANNFLTERECQESCVLGGGKVTVEWGAGTRMARIPSLGGSGDRPGVHHENLSIAPSRPKPTPPTTVKPHSDARRCLCPTYPSLKFLPTPAYCTVPRVTGPCRASFLRWYYSPANRTCRQFIYGGCRGNKNNYQHEEECLKRCSPKPGEGGLGDVLVFLSPVRPPISLRFPSP
uniref:BPTI/Kunitz inhibitor domain-containing protein n=1 Tax=Buteo japonicus TaxID=224669 RepID=A0A8C0BDH3_9AVES